MDRKIAESLLDTLAARQGIVAVVGAGGKKSTLYRLLDAHRSIDTRRVAITSTVQIAPAKALDAEMVVAQSVDMLDALRSTGAGAGTVFMAAPSGKPGRLAGLPGDLVARLHDEGSFDVALVKADGARMRMIKAPNDDEPVLPAATTTILPIVSARAFGRPVSSAIAHRPERLADVIAARPGDLLSPDHVAMLLASERGSLRRVGDAKVVPLINMVDTPERLALARQTAEKALSLTDRYDRVVLSVMTGADPVVDVVSA